MFRRSLVQALVRGSLAVSLVGVVLAEGPAADPAPAPVGPPRARNLQVLSPDTTLPEVYQIMGQWSVEVGLNCVACHSDPANPHLDETPAKKTAREMLELVRRINARLMAQKLPAKVTCGTCHQGRPKLMGRAVVRPDSGP